MQNKTIDLNIGSGGKSMHEFISKIILKHLGNNILNKMDDSAVLSNMKNSKLAMTTDSYVVDPIFFDGGDIGKLSVCGTVNDLSTSGAVPYAMSLSFILEEGFSLVDLEKIVISVADTCKKAKVKIVTGDTKVVPKGKGDKIFINTCSIGYIENGVDISSYNAKPGDDIIITGPIGNHEIAMLKARDEINFKLNIKSDVEPLNIKVKNLLKKTKNINVVKDPTRGGVASALDEICTNSNCEIEIFEEKLPVDKEVQSTCDLIGFDPLYLANEGKYLIICPKTETKYIFNEFNQAKIIGTVNNSNKANLILSTNYGAKRKLSMLQTTQLPRIC